MVVGIATTNAVVHPDAVRLVPICALVAGLAVLRSRWLDDLAIRAQLGARQFLENLVKL